MIRKDPSEPDLPSPVEYIECDDCGDFFHPDANHRCRRDELPSLYTSEETQRFWSR